MTPLVIASMASSGAGLVAESLSQHPEIFLYGEVLGQMEPIITAQQVIDVCFSDSEPTYRAITINGEQHERHPVLPGLVKMLPDVKVIVVRRMGQLDRVRSLQQLGMSLGFRSRKLPRTVALDPEITLFALNQARRFYVDLQTTLDGISTLYVIYEDLRSDFSLAMEPVWAFLGLEPPAALVEPAPADEDGPVTETVTNLGEIRRLLASTPFAFD